MAYTVDPFTIDTVQRVDAIDLAEADG